MQYHSIARGTALGTILAAVWMQVEAQDPTRAPRQPQRPRPLSSSTWPGGTGSHLGGAAAAAPYQLVEVAGKPLPAVIDKGWRCREEVTAATLTLGNGGSWLLQTATRGVCGERMVEMETDTKGGHYAMEGQTVRFYDDDGRPDRRDRDLGAEIDLDDVDTGTLAPDGTLAVRLDDGGAALVFRR